MNMFKQTCLFVANTNLHATAKHNEDAWISGCVYVCRLHSRALWVIHKCSEESVKCTMKPDGKNWCPTRFLNPHLHRFGWLCMPWTWCQCNSESAAREHKNYRSYINNQRFRDSFFTFDNWIFASVLFLTSDYHITCTNLHLRSTDNQSKLQEF